MKRLAGRHVSRGLVATDPGKALVSLNQRLSDALMSWHKESYVFDHSNTGS